MALFQSITVLCVLAAGLSISESALVRSIVEGPQNAWYYPSESALLHCAASGPSEVVQWQEYTTTPTGSVISINNQTLPGHPNSARYSLIVDYAARSYDLVVNPTILNDGGLYRCMDTSTLSNPAFAQLVLIDADPVCTTNIPANGFVIEGVYYTIECTMYFRGIGPNVTWTGPPDTLGAVWGQLTTYGNSTVFSAVNMNMTRYFSNFNFTVRFNFSGEGFVGIPNQADNIPDYDHVISYQPFFVRWAPGHMYVSPDGPYEIGTLVTCFADSSPESTYSWQNMITNQVITNQSMLLTSNLVGTTPFRCSASNGIGQNFLEVNITVNPVTTPTVPPTTTTTTPPPAEGKCNSLTGRWRATWPTLVDLCLEVNPNDGTVIGLFRNATDPVFIEVRGLTKQSNNDELGFVGVWPVNVGTQGFTGVCTACFGQEHLQITAVGRSILDFQSCSNFGRIQYTQFYNFDRFGGPCRNLFQEYGIKV